MKNQEFIVNEETLTDGSTVYNVVAFDGNHRITLSAIDKATADDLAESLNEGLAHFSVATLPSAA